jgi:hypothetical protein
MSLETANNLVWIVLVCIPGLFLLVGFILWGIRHLKTVRWPRQQVRVPLPSHAERMRMLDEILRSSSANVESLTRNLANLEIRRRVQTEISSGSEIEIRITSTIVTPEPPKPPPPEPPKEPEKLSPTIYERLGKDTLDES